MRVLVAGASGYLGRMVVAELSRRGHRVRALIRDPAKREALDGLAEETVIADARRPADVAGCCEGVDAVISTIGLMKASARTSFHDVDYGANHNLLDEARRARAGTFVYVSVLQAPGMERLKIVRAKRAFEQELERSGLAFTILRPTGYFSDMDQFLQMARRGRVYVFGGGRWAINPIDGADVARAAADALDATATVVELGGPDVLTHRQIAEEAFAALGAPVRITSVPRWVARASIGLLRHTTPQGVHGAAEFVLTVLSRDMVAQRAGTASLREHFHAEAGAGPDGA